MPISKNRRASCVARRPGARLRPAQRCGLARGPAGAPGAEASLLDSWVLRPWAGLLMTVLSSRCMTQEAHSRVSKQESPPSGPCPNPTWSLTGFPVCGTVPEPRSHPGTLVQEGQECVLSLAPSLSFLLRGSGCECQAGPEAGDQVGPGKPN